MDHFEGKSAFEHIQEARIKTKSKLKETHAVETKSFIDAFIRLILETAIFLGILKIFSLSLHISDKFLFILLFSFIFSKVILCALDGWCRLQRLHRVISEERFEIEHHEEQEKQELIALYQAKGFEGKLLEDVISVLMADRNRLLSVMLEEELGLKIESYDHPLLQALGALVGGLAVFFTAFIASFFSNPWIDLSTAFIFVFIGAYSKAYIEKISRMKTSVWHIANFLFLVILLYLILKNIMGQ